ncbi:alpha/beta fold hydrolase [Streptomyces sp. MBT62]|uniref:alpha/beta fold hydrolase n=1 Tax=Streptomyces sp. MBT62 TaxID=2800410 RepID=UPI00190AB194|nr:alpha/beta hydrolase [Streptomyces sp. MBT62]MBK3563012.1 alpha/beta hydrolase [Streptomyces sp. MBT62]
MRSLYLPEAGGRLRWIDLPGEGPARVYVHGLGCAGSADFAGIAAHPDLRGGRAIVVDLLGHGYSDRPKDFPGTLEAHAGTVAAVLDHCGITDAVLVGHSMGGAIAIVLTAARPDLVSRLVVAEPNLRAGGGLFSGAIAAYGEEDFVSHGFHTVLAGLEPDYAARMRVADPAIVHRSAVGLVTGTNPGTGELLYGLPQPRVLLIGTRSRPYADEPAVRQAGIPVVEVPDAGHHMMGDNPEGFVAALVESGAGPVPRGEREGSRSGRVGS